jgi:lipoprotein-releasing system permease protein
MILQPEGLLLAPGETPAFEKVKVKKIVSTNLADIDSQYLFYIRDLSLNSLRASLSRQVGIEVWLEKPFKVKGVKEEIKEELQTKEKDWVVESWMDRNSALFYALKLEKIMIGIFLGLAGLVSSFSIITVLALLISEKTRDIAMLRTLGLSQKSTIQIFIKMGMVISSIGLFIGAFLGLFLGIYIEKHPLNILPDIYYDSTIPARVEYGLFFLVLIVSLGIAFLGAYIPTRALEKITPSQALRQKN